MKKTKLHLATLHGSLRHSGLSAFGATKAEAVKALAVAYLSRPTLRDFEPLSFEQACEYCSFSVRAIDLGKPYEGELSNLSL